MEDTSVMYEFTIAAHVQCPCPKLPLRPLVDYSLSLQMPMPKICQISNEKLEDCDGEPMKYIL